MGIIDNKIRRTPNWRTGLALLILAGIAYAGQQPVVDWQQGIRDLVAQHQLNAALTSVDGQIQR